MREITYGEAISEATVQAMEKHPEVFVIGEGVDDASGIFGTTKAAHEKFGDERVMDCPLSENGVTGAALGAGIMGMHPLIVYARMDFMLLPLDEIANHGAKWSYMYGGTMSAPLTMRAIIGRGWGQGGQHSQSLQSLFTHIPGLKVVMPTFAYDAKGLLLASLEEKCPVVFIEHRWLHKEKGNVPEEYYTLPFGKAKVVKEGTDLTIVGISQGTLDSLKAAEVLAEKQINAEVVDLISLKPLDRETILKSVKKTGRLVIVDTAWKMCGMAGEIAATVAEECPEALQAPVKRICLNESPAPTSFELEKLFYPQVKDIVNASLEVCSQQEEKIENVANEDLNKKRFEGSF